MRGYPQWRWHLDEAFVKVNGELCYLWRAVDHEGEVLEAVVTAKRDKAAALKFLKRIMKKYGRPLSAPAMPKLVAQITLVMPAAFECELREQRLREAIAQGAVSGIVTFDKITCSRLLPARNSLIQKSRTQSGGAHDPGVRDRVF